MPAWSQYSPAEPQAVGIFRRLLWPAADQQRTRIWVALHITVNGYNARNDNELAQIVADKINEMIDQDDSVYK